MRKISRNTVFIGLTIALVLAGVSTWWFKGGQPVTVVQVSEGALEEQVRGSARVRARVAVTLSARVTAAIIAMEADIGDAVRRDQVLVRLDDRDLRARTASAGATLARAQADLALATSNERRDKEVFEKGYISAAAMDATVMLRRAKAAEATAVAQEIKLADTQASYANLRSPMAGIVVARLAEPGNMVSPGAPLLRLIDPTTLQVVARIDETEAGRLQPGMPVLIRLRTGGEVTGKVSRIALEADVAAREFEVEITFDKPLTRFAIDQEAEVAIRVGTALGQLVPLSALIRQEGKVGVLRVQDGRARFQPVETGTSGNDMILIKKGLSVGDTLVREAQTIRAGARVRIENN
ncbi:MAG: efflux RND transporter periplasmic adaptor subunit [Rhodocyclaceae bacterium]|nr:efflux RND transporter periplasmic adaptor subunit [Rhodocyclaceae bacterium]